MDFLILCTANQCRSPLAEGLLRRALADRGVAGEVGSAGFLPAGRPISDETIEVLAERSIEPLAPLSRRLDTELLARADLVIAMARLHVREAVVLDPTVFPRTFTLKELVRRGTGLGPRKPGEPVDDWIARAHVGRDHTLHQGESPDDDVADPVGESVRVFRSVADELERNLDQVLDLLWPPDPTGR